MKRIFVLLISISLVTCLYAVPSKKYKLVVKTTDSEYSYALYNQPEISFTSTDMVITIDQENVRFAKSDIVEFLLDYNQYKVTFLDWDGDTLQSNMLNYGEMPEYLGATPTKPEDEQYIYTFLGWEPEITLVIDNATYSAVYEAIEKVGSFTENITTDIIKPRKVYIQGNLYIIIGDHIYSCQGHRIK